MALQNLKLHKQIVLLPVLFMLVFVSCVETMDKDAVYKVSVGYMIDEFLEKTPDLSTCYELLQISTFSGMLHGYGSYTLFAPTNAAFDTYLASINKTDISQLTQAEADLILKFHIVRDSIKTTDLIDGRLPSPTISGKFLTNRTMSDDIGNIFIEMNRQGKILLPNFSCDNGVVHIVDVIMTPPTFNIIGGIKTLPDSLFSISKHITLKYSRFSPDSLSSKDLEASFFTWFGQDNQSYIDLGIGITKEMVSRDSSSIDWAAIEELLLVRLRNNQPSEANDTTLLSQFADYHFVKSIKFVSDLLFSSTLESSVLNQSLSFKLNGETLRVNYFVIGSTIEPGVVLNRRSDFSDYSCSNGVIHYIGGHIEIKSRSAYRVYWDMAEQPEIMALKDFRKAGVSVAYGPSDLSEVEWGGGIINNVWYISNGNWNNTSLDTKSQYIYGDMMRFRFSPNINSWFEWKLPLLVAGKYKVWLCWRREQTTTFRTIFKQEGKDDQVLPYVFDLGAYSPILFNSSGVQQTTEEANLADGWKQYAAKRCESVVNSRLLGTIVVEATGRHSLRFEDLTGRSGETSWDMIQFIPVDEDQLWPRVDMRGKWVYPDTPDCEIWPYNVRTVYNYQGECVW